MVDLCNILEQLHSIEPAVIHRDIKPSNVIISSYNRAVLLDFNAAKYFSSTSAEDTVLLGTQGYAAPEQYGFGASSPLTDIYSMGILLKEMLEAISEFSEHLDWIVSKCTQINPSERFNNIRELKSALLTQTKPKSENQLIQNLLKFAPPGYRTVTPWKMWLASICYISITGICLAMEVRYRVGTSIWLRRIFTLLILLFVIFGSFNYMNIQNCVPLCKHPKRGVRYIGIAILDITLAFTILFVLFIIEEICLSV